MARSRNALGNIVAGTMSLLKEDAPGTVEMSGTDPETLVPRDVVQNMPDPFCLGKMIFAQADGEEIMLHFSKDPKRLTPLLTALMSPEHISGLASGPTIVTADVRGDWHRLVLGGKKMLIVDLHQITLTSSRPAPASISRF